MTDEAQGAPAPETTVEQPTEQPADTTAPAEPQSADKAEPTGTAATPESPGEESADEAPKKKGSFQKRISELSRERNEERIRREQVERERDELRRKLEPDAVPKDEPKLEQFDTVEDFLKAHTAWAREEGRKLERTEREQLAEQQQVIKTKAAIQAREAEARTKYPDFDQAVSPVAPIIMSNPVLKLYVSESEQAMDVAYHLAKNPEKLLEINGMSPFAAARELYRIEDRLKAAPSKPLTKAPEPIKPVGTREKVSKGLGDLADSDDASAYIARMNKAKG